MHFLGLILLFLLAGCSSDTPNTTRPLEAFPDAMSDTKTTKDVSADLGKSKDAVTTKDSEDLKSSEDLAVTPFEPGPTPTKKLQPKLGEITFYQLELPPGLVPKLGEAGIIVGPKGSIALLDIGNTNHDDEVREAIKELNTKWLTPEFGFAQRDPLQVEWIILTHIHGDHIGGFENLLIKEKLTGVKGILHRGFVNLGPGMNEQNYEVFCDAMRGEYAAVNMPICVSAESAPCDRNLLKAYKATECKGLLMGNLLDSTDDSKGEKSYIDFDGATIELVGANAHFHDGIKVVKSPDFPNLTGSQENARSLVGIIKFGKFRYHFGGDLHGVNDGKGPDMESFLVESSSGFYGDLGMDVIHSHHHGRKTSSNPAFVDMVAPNDGLSRNVIAGISLTHLGSPQEEVVKAWQDNGRLGEGHLWITRNTPGGATSSQMINADGSLAIQTVQGGRGYWMQGVGDEIISKSYESVR